MKQNQHISNSEMQLMAYIWKTDHPVTTAEIMRNLPEEIEWSQKTVITFLGRLIKKNVLKATQIGRAFHYEACLTEQDYLMLHLEMR
jgi:predicted transcriptional regulator